MIKMAQNPFAQARQGFRKQAAQPRQQVKMVHFLNDKTFAEKTDFLGVELSLVRTHVLFDRCAVSHPLKCA